MRNNPARIGWLKNNISAGRMRTPRPCGMLVCVSAFSQCFSLSFCWDHLSLYPYMLHLPHLTLPLLGLKQQCQHDFALEALFCTGPKSFLWIFTKKKRNKDLKLNYFFFHFKDTPAVNIFHFQNVFDMFIGKKVSKLQASGWLLPHVWSRACWESHSLWGFGFILNRCVKVL